MSDEERLRDGARCFAIRRQQVIFVTLMAVGACLMAGSFLTDWRLLGDGIAFLLAGGVGMIMSWSSMAIGNEIKGVISETSSKQVDILNDIRDSQNRMVDTQNGMANTLTEIKDSQNRMADTQNGMANTLTEIKNLLEKNQVGPKP